MNVKIVKTKWSCHTIVPWYRLDDPWAYFDVLANTVVKVAMAANVDIKTLEWNFGSGRGAITTGCLYIDVSGVTYD